MSPDLPEIVIFTNSTVFTTLRLVHLQLFSVLTMIIIATSKYYLTMTSFEEFSTFCEICHQQYITSSYAIFVT